MLVVLGELRKVAAVEVLEEYDLIDGFDSEARSETLRLLAGEDAARKQCRV